MDVPRFFVLPPLEYSVHISLTSSSSLKTRSINNKRRENVRDGVGATVFLGSGVEEKDVQLTNSYDDHRPLPFPTVYDCCEH